MFQIRVSEREPFARGSAPCAVTVSIAGYRSQQVRLAPDMRVNLAPLAPTEGSAMSFTVEDAPIDAQKAYSDGYEAEKTGNWPGAQRNYEKAVAIYPKYAAAWVKLADCAEHDGRLTEAADALAKAEEADPRYMEPYVHWTNLAIGHSDWNRALSESAKAIALNPVEFPKVYLLHAVAALSLGQWSAAQNAASEAIANDPGHQFPLSEYVLAVALDRQNNGSAAEKHFRQYLTESPDGPHAAEARTRISALAPAQTTSAPR